MKKEEYTELLTIIRYMEKEQQEKIPKKLIEFFERNSVKDYEFDIDLDVPLKNQNLKAKTLSLLAMLNLNYWCENEEHKQELIKQYSENERKYQEELREKYNLDNIFKKHDIEQPIEENIVENTLAMVEYKEPFLKKVINKIKSIFNIN